MEFRLIYEGPLYAEKSFSDSRQPRLKHKQDIRHHFHRQLCELWEVDSRLNGLARVRGQMRDETTGELLSFATYLDAVGHRHQTGGIKWVPLVSDRLGNACSLNILFLRREPKGGIIQSGDLDNRIKTLFDALRIPEAKEIPSDAAPESQPNPFFCLMSNDTLITDFRVTADRFLVPSEKGGDANVHLVIEVRTLIVDHQKADSILGGHIHK